MRVEFFDPDKFDQDFENVAISRLLDAAYIVKDEVVRQLRSRIGSGETTGISRPVYKSGPYAGLYWTARDFGALLTSIRVVERKTKSGRPFKNRKKNIRVYAGTKKAFYARIFEYNKPFMRPALYGTLDKVKAIIGAV